MFRRLAVVTVGLQILSLRPLLERLGNRNYTADKRELVVRATLLFLNSKNQASIGM